MANGAFFEGGGNPWLPYLFQRAMLGRTNDEIEAFRQEAIDYFSDRFGLNFNDPANADRLSLEPFYVTPDRGYRAYTVSGEDAPAEGWQVHDGGFSLIVTDPAGITLGGEFAGQIVPVGTSFPYGNYWINAQRANGDDTPIILGYKTQDPVIRDQFGKVAFRCFMFSDEYGEGLANGIQYAVEVGDGRTQNITRNIITFPGVPTPSPLN